MYIVKLLASKDDIYMSTFHPTIHNNRESLLALSVLVYYYLKNSSNYGLTQSHLTNLLTPLLSEQAFPT